MSEAPKIGPGRRKGSAANATVNHIKRNRPRPDDPPTLCGTDLIVGEFIPGLPTCTDCRTIALHEQRGYDDAIRKTCALVDPFRELGIREGLRDIADTLADELGYGWVAEWSSYPIEEQMRPEERAVITLARHLSVLLDDDKEASA